MKIAVITGASSGMGRELAVAVTKEERFDQLWVIARRADRLEELKKLVECPVRVLAMDLTEPESLARYRGLLAEEQPEIRLLANVSGYGRFGSYRDIPLEDSLNMIDLNVKALVAVTELSLPYMDRGGRILQLDSMSAFLPLPYLNVYAATKAFVLHYSRGLNRELKRRGIRVLAVCPYWVQTGFFAAAEKTGNGKVKVFDKVYSPQRVVRSAVKALYRGRSDVHVPGLYAKVLHAGMKLIPASLGMTTWLKQQGLDQ